LILPGWSCATISGEPIERVPPEEYGKATIRITVTNPSPSAPRNVSIRHELPREILAADVVDAGELEMRTDFTKGVCYLYKESLEIPPLESVEFNVLIMDKWNVNDGRIRQLKSVVGEMQRGKQAWTKYKAIMNELQALAYELEGMECHNGPETVDEQYVAYYRDEGRELDRIENMINRIKNAPYRALSTWGIISGILIFLALASAIVILRSHRKNPF
jgi:hypothetical protein